MGELPRDSLCPSVPSVPSVPPRRSAALSQRLPFHQLHHNGYGVACSNHFVNGYDARQVCYKTNDRFFSGSDAFTFTVTDRGYPDNCGSPGSSCLKLETSKIALVQVSLVEN
jgi:hypothetical protein